MGIYSILTAEHCYRAQWNALSQHDPCASKYLSIFDVDHAVLQSITALNVWRNLMRIATKLIHLKYIK